MANSKRIGFGRTATALAGLLVLSGCAAGSDQERTTQSAEGRTRVERIRLPGGDYGYPSPFGYVLGPGLVNVNFLFDTLLWKDSTGQPIPWLAEAWEHSPDGREWRFTLREGVRWQDGQPLTAEDVVFTFDYLTNGEGKANPG